MAEIIRTRKISPLTRKATSVSYKIDTKGVAKNDTLRVEICHSDNANRWVYTFDGNQIADKNSLSFRVKEVNNETVISWGSLLPKVEHLKSLKNNDNNKVSIPILLKKDKQSTTSNIKTSFQPIVDEQTRVLILGSLPGDESIRKQQYYANPRNQFWKIISVVIGEPLPPAYHDNVTLLLKHNIGLWDVCHSANRIGSIDVNITNEKLNDIIGLLKSYPSVKTVLFNGAKAKATYDKHLVQESGIIYNTLVSSSAAATIGLIKKIDLWKSLLNKKEVANG